MASISVTTDALDDAEPGTASFAITLDDVLHAPHAVAATATNTNGSTSKFSACKTAHPAPSPSRTRTTYTGPTTMTYSDPASLSGKLEDVSADPQIGVPGKQLEFSLGEMPTIVAGPTASDGAVSAAPTAVTLVPGPATVETTFAGDAG